MERNLTETPKRFSLSSLRRRWWLIPLAVVMTAAAAFAAAQLKESNYTASSWLVTSSDDGFRGPGRAFDASRLALTYATSLPEDDQLIAHIARAIDRSPDEVDDNFTVVNQPDTAAVRLRYSDDDPEVARAGARAAAEGASGREPAAASVTPGTLSVVRLADESDESTDFGLLALALGALLGLGLGIILMLALERADPRLDEPRDVQELTGIPASRLDDLTPGRAAALLERWHALAGKQSARVAIVPTPKLEDLAGLTAGWLYGLHTDGPDLAADSNGHSAQDPEADDDRMDIFHAQRPGDPGPEGGERWRSRWYRPSVSPGPYPEGGQSTLHASPPQTITVEDDALTPEQITGRPEVERPAPARAERISLTAAGPAGSDAGPEVEALRSDVLVVLVQKAAPAGELTDLVDTLAQFGRRPEWVLMVDSVRKVHKQMDRAQAAGVNLRASNGTTSAGPGT
jgi:capsular polysaccharide biosynthesis protein